MVYEVSPWRTVGGQSGTYELEALGDTACEFILTQVSGNIAGTVVIGFDSGDDLSSVTANYATSVVNTPGWRGIVLRVAANTPVIFPADPIPVIEPRRIYVRILTDSAGAIYVTGHFRRPAIAPDTYAHSAQNMQATAELAPSARDTASAEVIWSENLAQDNSSASAQSSRRRQGSSTLRRSTSSRRESLLTRITSK